MTGEYGFGNRWGLWRGIDICAIRPNGNELSGDTGGDWKEDAEHGNSLHGGLG